MVAVYWMGPETTGGWGDRSHLGRREPTTLGCGLGRDASWVGSPTPTSGPRHRQTDIGCGLLVHVMASNPLGLAVGSDAGPEGAAFPTPAQIVAALDRTVFGQAAAKRTLALAVYKHYVGLASNEVDSLPPAFGHQHVLMIGPTGSGKTHLVRELARFVSAPVAFCPATRLVETGYVGEQVESVVRSLLAVAGGDASRAARGIIVLDEIDKIRRAGGSGRDVSGQGVQNGLLTLLDGVRVPVHRDDQSSTIDTSGILFLAAGAFVGLDEIVARRAGATDLLGFSARGRVPAVAAPCTTEDLIEYGLIPEFVGRFRHVCRLDGLEVGDLARLVVEVEGSAMRRTQDFLAAHGAHLEFTRPALHALAKRAAELGTGARALERVVAEVIEPIEWRVLAREARACRVVVGVAAVRDPRLARLLPLRTRQHASVDRLRERAQALAPPTDAPIREFTNTRGWPVERIRERIAVVRERIRYPSATTLARTWWDSFEQGNQQRLPHILRLMEELVVRKSSIDEFFIAYGEAKTEHIQATLHYLDYLRLKREQEESEKKVGPRKPKAG